MSLFNKKPKGSPPHKSQKAIIVDTADLNKADEVLQNYLRVVGTTDIEMRVAALAIAEAGGALDSEEAIRIMAQTGESVIDRPWLWLVEVAREAHRQDNKDLVAKVSLFVFFWMTKIDPIMGLGDRLDMRLSTPSQETLVEFYSIAIRTLHTLDQDKVITSNQSGTVNVRGLLSGCAQQALSMESQFDQETMKLAKASSS